MTRRFLTYQLSFLLLLTHLGVPVFTHVCNGRGETRTSVLLPTGSCCAKKDLSKREKNCGTGRSCCASSAKSDPCCDNRISFEQVDSELPNIAGEGSNTNLPALSNAIPVSDKGLIEKTTSSLFQPHAPPNRHARISPVLLYGAIRC